MTPKSTTIYGGCMEDSSGKFCEVSLECCPGGFGDLQRQGGDGRGEAYDDRDNLLDAIREGLDYEPMVQLVDGVDLPAGVEDIRGHVRDCPTEVWAVPFVGDDGQPSASYFGIEHL